MIKRKPADMVQIIDAIGLPMAWLNEFVRVCPFDWLSVLHSDRIFCPFGTVHVYCRQYDIHCTLISLLTNKNAEKLIS